MRKVTIGEVVAVLAFVGGIVVWGVRLEGRIDRQDTQIAQVKEQMRDAVAQIRDDVAYIRQRIDQATQGR